MRRQASRLVRGIGATALVVLVGCGTRVTERRPLEFINDMKHQPKEIPQAPSTFFADGAVARPPVEGTISRGQRPYPYKGMSEVQAVPLIGPNPLPETEAILARGRNRYNTFCIACHGAAGHGNGLVIQHGYPTPPELNTAKVREWPDATIYHIISNGQGIMPSYASQISALDRWAITHYLRRVQAAELAQPSKALTDIGGPRAAQSIILTDPISPNQGLNQ